MANDRLPSYDDIFGTKNSNSNNNRNTNTVIYNPNDRNKNTIIYGSYDNVSKPQIPNAINNNSSVAGTGFNSNVQAPSGTWQGSLSKNSYMTSNYANKNARNVKGDGYKRPQTIDVEEHFKGHEAECEECDYIEMFNDLDRQKLKEMFVFSEVIGKPKALRKK